jgi:DNA-binding transcriptional MerR regulator
MPYKPYILQKKYYTIGEVATILDLNATVLRFWEKQFSAIKPAKNRKGNRVYTHFDIELLEKIRFLVKDRGFTLKGAAEQLQQKPSPAESDPKREVLVRLVKIKGFLEELKKELGR